MVGIPEHSELTFLYLFTYKYVCHSEKIHNTVVVFCIIFNTRVERLHNEDIVNGDDHDTTFHVLVMSSKLTTTLSYYLARLILTFLVAYPIPYQ